MLYITYEYLALAIIIACGHFLPQHPSDWAAFSWLMFETPLEKCVNLCNFCCLEISWRCVDSLSEKVTRISRALYSRCWLRFYLTKSQSWIFCQFYIKSMPRQHLPTSLKFVVTSCSVSCEIMSFLFVTFPILFIFL